MFVHLHNHTHYSLLDGLIKIPDLVKKAKEYNMPALAITDHGNMYGAVEFYQECQKQDIKPIIGVEVYVAARSRFDKEPRIDSRRYHLTLLAKNETGYRNLIKLVTKANLEGFYYKPRVDWELLQDHAKGVICLSGCMGGQLSRLLLNKDHAGAEKLARDYAEAFGPDNYYIEIMHHPKIEGQIELAKNLIALARKLNLPLVATHDTHYLNKDDSRAHHTLLAIQTGNDVDDVKGVTNMEEDFSFVSAEEMASFFPDTPDALENTLKISEACNLELVLGKFVFPNFELDDDKTADEVLRQLAFSGLAKRGLDKDEAAIARLNHELEVIKIKGYASYFLVVEDLIRFARENNIYYNIRGSVAGSLTTYSLDITKVNPLAYHIPFERFLNPERPSAPDIDMDFADNKRDKIIDYAKQKYGGEKVAQIGTFGTMMARGSVRDVARALGFPYQAGDQIAKLIPMGSQGFPMTIDRALEMVPELKEMYNERADTKEIIDMAKKIEGCARHISVHAAGVVIAPAPLDQYVPLQYDPKGVSVITQYDMYSVGEDGVGLTKFDFLGLRNLAILSSAVEIIETVYNRRVDMDGIPMDDKKTFEMLARGETEGLFQLNGSGMTKWLKELRPTTIHDINAMVALYRPGPMQFIPDYIARKHNPRLIKYLDPSLESILEQSYGVLVYQDDLLIMANKLAGYSWGEVDKFRKAVGKKIPELMAKQREKFIKGCIEHSGWKKEKAEEVWAWLEPFAAYGFNKAHSASYGRVAYQTAYLKANYPSEYMTAVLSAESGDVEKVAVIIGECKRMNISVLPPDINESFGDFTVIKNAQDPNLSEKAKKLADKNPDPVDKIRFGLFTIKNLGAEIAQFIVDERKKNGPYRDLGDFLTRVKHKNLNKKSLEALAKAGALDSLGESRVKFLANLEEILAFNREETRNNANQTSLFGLMSDDAPKPTLKLRDADPIEPRLKLAWEKELLGLYVSGHPLDAHREKFNKLENTIGHQKNKSEGFPIVTGGIIGEVRAIFTKNNKQMAFFKLSDFNDMVECVAFSDVYEKYKALLVEDKCIALKGKLNYRNGEPSVLVEAIKEL